MIPLTTYRVMKGYLCMFVFACDLELARPVSARAESAKLAGVPVQRFTKPIVRAGTYVDGEQRYDITNADLERWARNFSAMKANGFTVTIPDDHDTVGESEHTFGVVNELYQIGDTLHMIATITGSKGIEMALTVGSSIGVTENDWRDGENNSYEGNVLHHVAMTPVPVVGGLGTFIPIELALKAKHSETEIMDIDKAALCGAFKLSAKTKDAEVLTKVTDAHQAIVDAAEADKTKVVTLSQQVKDLKAAAKPGAPVVEVDENMLTLARDNVDLQLSASVQSGRMTPAARKLFEAELVDGDKLSMRLSQGGGLGFYKQVLKIINANDPKELKEVSGAQTGSMELSDGLKGKDKVNLLHADADRRAKAATPNQRTGYSN